MADDPKKPKDDAAKAQELMGQLSGVLNNPAVRSLMSSGQFSGAANARPGSEKSSPKPDLKAMPGMMPSKPLPPIKPLGSPGAPGPVPLSPERLNTMVDQLGTVVSQMDMMIKALA